MRFFTFISLFLVSFSAFSKEKCKQYMQQATKQITFYNAGIGMPPHVVNGRIHAGFELGLQHKLIAKSPINYDVLAGYFSQRALQNATYVKLGMSYGISIKKKMNINPSIHFSSMYVCQLNNEFKYVGNGNYEEVKKARFQFMPSIGLEANCPLFKTKSMTIKGLFKYEFGVQLPFSLLSSILPINQIHVGLQFKK